MINFTTDIRDAKDNLVRSEKALTLKEYILMKRELTPGMHFSLVNKNFNTDGKPETYTGYESFYIGNATPYHEPNSNDGGFGWDLDHERMEKYISEIHLPMFSTKIKE